MKTAIFETVDANEAVAQVAYSLSEVIAIYPITPASPMGEWADAWAAKGQKNLWGTVPSVVELQSEAGAAGAIHGALQTGSLATTFTASQGLLLMIPNMYKIAGELTSAVFHIAARSLAAQALSIFGDHSDVMAARATGWAMLCSSSVQEAKDLALVSHAATLEARIPFMHFFDGFRTSHEIAKIEPLGESVLKAMVSQSKIDAHRARGLTPDRPVIHGTSQNPDVYFQAREGVNNYYNACPEIVQRAMDKFATLTGRQYKLYEYYGAKDAERVVILMGSGCDAARETVDHLRAVGEKVGLVNVRLFRPFDINTFVAALPASTKSIAVLDRTKEPGSAGEPLYLDCVNALVEAYTSGKLPCPALPRVVGGRYGLSSKEFTASMVAAIFDNLAQKEPKNHFTIGITDDVSHTSLDWDPDSVPESSDVYRALFYGIGSDGTVGANKEAIKIIGENTDFFCQGYFVYDSKKSGATTVSHLRFGPRVIRSSYLIRETNFLAVHHPSFLAQEDLAEPLVKEGAFLMNAPWPAEEIWNHIPQRIQADLIRKKARVYTIDASKIARQCGITGRINTIMETCFFEITKVLPEEKALEAIKDSILKAYGKRGEAVIRMNMQAVEQAVANLQSVPLPRQPLVGKAGNGAHWAEAPVFVRNTLWPIMAGRGDMLPVSALPADGEYPSGTARFEKRNLASHIPAWDSDACIQCGKCVFVCPHAAIRSKVYSPNELADSPEGFLSKAARLPDFKGLSYTLQVAPEDCTGCGICVDVCPAKNKTQPDSKAINMVPQLEIRDREKKNWKYFEGLPDLSAKDVKLSSVREIQSLTPLFEFSGACAGCGETPYLKLLTQLFGDRMLVANATGCSSIYGGNLPTTPWSKNKQGRGPAWSNSLFEDNAEFGLGFRVSLDKQTEFAAELLKKVAPKIGDDLVAAILNSDQKDAAGVEAQRKSVALLKRKLSAIETEDAARLLTIADALVRKSVWIIGGDGWAYDIGFGGLDHVLASGRNVKVLVLDTEVYSNTGGQNSKSTPKCAVAKFAAAGKAATKKDLGLMAMSYGSVYVASVAMGAKDEHTLKTFLEAEAYDGPSLIIAYSHCIAHGINMTTALQNQKAAVKTGQWLLYRYNPDRAKTGENPLQLDSAPPAGNVREFFDLENRFKQLASTRPGGAKALYEAAQADLQARRELYEYLAGRKPKAPSPEKNGNGHVITTGA